MDRKHAIKQSIEKLKSRQQKQLDVDKIVEGLCSGSTSDLSTAITLLESTAPEKRAAGLKILDACMPKTGNAKRVGITGVPGVGKSTFIEAFGLELIEQGAKIAVLAIDPSSQISKGSILGDKTRMEDLSAHPKAYIRPSPAGSMLGGVAARTRETILLCEAAGFDVILIETVGVGQSETMVHSMVDFFLLLMLAGAGDELQGIKRGIMELADQIVINKADGDNVQMARKAKVTYGKAVHLFPPRENGWATEVSTCSALNKDGVQEISTVLNKYFKTLEESIEKNRQEQNIFWFREAVNDLIQNQILQAKELSEDYQSLEKQVLTGQLSPFGAATKLINVIKNAR